MEEIQPRDGVADAQSRSLRRILITACLVLAVLVLVAVAIYAGAFIILAPMMQ